MRRVELVVLLLCGLAFAASPAFAQERYRGTDPNLGHFYMARQEIQIMDDAPQVNDMRTQPAPPGKSQAAPANKPAPLPHAGFMPYSQSTPTMRSSLPSTFSGVPTKMPPPSPQTAAKSAKAGAYKGKKPAAAPVAASVPQVKTYAPVKGYGSGTPTMVPTANSGSSAVSTKVQGSLMNRGPSALHWSRTR